MDTNSRVSQNRYYAGRQVAKDTKDQALNHLTRAEFPRIFLLFDCVPYLSFSEVGRRNICHRFRISEQTLDSCLSAYLRPDEPETDQARRDADLQRVLTTTPELLNTIGEAVKPRKGVAKKSAKAKEGPTKW